MGEGFAASVTWQGETLTLATLRRLMDVTRELEARTEVVVEMTPASARDPQSIRLSVQGAGLTW